MNVLYSGRRERLSDRGLALEPFQPSTNWTDPAFYVASDDLRDAVNVALELGQPLLLTGEPGSGKTQLAASIAWEFNLPLRVFNVKTTSTAKDLFYRYDSLRHFQAANQSHNGNSAEVRDFITPEALGLAILQSLETPAAGAWLTAEQRAQAPTRSVVLIDEIDKAPRDLPNDVLNEFERMTFDILETRESFVAAPSNCPILLLTSNSEKNLPDAFLRRCVYFHIHPPTRAELEEIVRLRVPLREEFSNAMLQNALTYFGELQAIALSSKKETCYCGVPFLDRGTQ